MIDKDHAEFLEDSLATLAHPDNGESAMVQAVAGGFILLARHLEQIAQPPPKDRTVEFARFLARYVARKGELATEEAHALYEDFYFDELEKEKNNEPPQHS